MDSVFRFIGLAISALAGAAAVLAAVAQVTAGARLRRSADRLQTQFQASELGSYDRGIAISLYRQDIAKLVALRALPVRYFAVPLFALVVPLLGFVGYGRIYAQASGRSKGWSAVLDSGNVESFAFPVSLLVPLTMLLFVTGGLTGLLSVLLGRLHIEQDYLSEKTLEKEPSYWDGSARAMLTLGWRGRGECVVTAAGLASLAFGTGAVIDILTLSPTDLMPASALLCGVILVFFGLMAFGSFMEKQRGEWRHTPFPIQPSKTSEQNHPPRQSRRRFLFWKGRTRS